jgi:hypothetical protein
MTTDFKQVRRKHMQVHKTKAPATDTSPPTADTSEPNNKNASADTSTPTEPIVAHNVETKTDAGRPLEIIAADIRALERGNAFDIGALLAEARKDAEYGEWASWLESEFDWSPQTATNYMSAHRLAEQYPTVRFLPLPMRAVYRLGNDFKPDDPNLPSIIKALTAATKGKPKVISVAEADDVIELALLRIEYGDYPDATLNALADLGGGPWTASAAEALKAKRPTTAEEAEQITDAAHRAHVNSLYAPFGGLPDDFPDNALWTLGEVSEEQRGAVLEQIKYLARPLTDIAIFGCANDLAEARERQEAIKDAADRAAKRAAKEARQSGKVQQSPGANSPDEIKRKLARLDELENENRLRAIQLAGYQSENEELKAAAKPASENDELKAAKPVRPSLIEAIETALDLAREEAGHNRDLSPDNAKKREKALTDITSGLAILMQLEEEAPPQRSVTTGPPEVRM